MRSAFVETSTTILEQDDRVVVILGDIGVFGFRNAFNEYPLRVFNLGILEQSMVGVGAGFSLGGHIPILHTIAPFLAERALEQIKIDFAYQELPGNLVTVGGSFDYSALGGTHHSPGDVGILLNVPSVEIFVPGTASEFSKLLIENYDNQYLSYFRLSEFPNEHSFEVQSGRGVLLQQGSRALVIAVGPTLNYVLPAVQNLDVTVLYLTSLRPFDEESVRKLADSGNILIVEPFYEGTTSLPVLTALAGKSVKIRSVGLPRRFMRGYGSNSEQLASIGFSSETIRKYLKELC